MFSFPTFAVLAIAAQFLFAGVDAAALPKRQNSTLPTQGGENSFDSIIQSFVSGFNGTFNATGPFNVNATFGLGNQGTSQFSSLFQQLIPAVFNGLTGTGNNVSLTGVTGQPPSFVGLGFSPANGTTSGGFDFTSIFSQISGPFSDILSSFINGSNVTTFPISPPGFNGTTPPFSGFNGTSLSFSGFNGTTPSFPGFNGTTPSFSGFNGTTPSFSGFNGTTPTFPGSNDTTFSLPSVPSISLPTIGSVDSLPLPTSDPTGVPSSIQVKFPSITVDVPEATPSFSSDPHFPTDVPVSEPTPSISSDDYLSTDVPVSEATPSIASDPALPTDTGIPPPSDA